ncbi:Cof-type HAD-IIB family hydrolase [Paenibacillus sp. HWE-109]|uniref:HAD-IIB family hydrolase n=1 Tax=Paenibacillus sp. HWE-109 TaxID=1306526 RepID=UPI001EDF1126|nr:HAD family hydrolase [Paenibacillus sp. HWE-109]UKS28566.1 Cof-type HAD-IIB family hydrolase [Paenibacillus sp. HWE-109]
MNFIFDMDGTICFKGQPISKRILDYLLELQQLGHFIGFASARPYRDMLPILDDRFYDHLLIGANGAMAFNEGKPLYYNPIPSQLANQIIKLLDDYQADFLVDDTLNYAIRTEKQHPLLMSLDQNQVAKHVELDQIESFIKIVVLSCSRFEELSQNISQLDVTIHYHSAEGILDITNRNVNKMTGLKQTGLQLESFVCMGNDMNDLPLFQKAQHSVLIGTYEPLRLIANHQILMDDNIEHNIISKLEELRQRRDTYEFICGE